MSRFPTLILFMLLFLSAPCLASNFNVLSYGANPLGRIDSTRAFSAAWSAACRSAYPATIYVPRGRFLLGKAVFDGGSCANKGLVVHMEGVLIADAGATADGDDWILFREVDGLQIRGGVLDAQGAGIWTCKMRGGHCPDGATSLRIMSSTNVMINDLTSINSQMFNIAILGCKDVQLRGVRVSSPGNSPNTDGIHVQDSTGVSILASKVSTGDDCVSVGPGTRGLRVEKMDCGPGHGISIGSLGRDVNEDGVQNVTVRDVRFTGTMNGVRIKSWAKPSNGFVRDVVFEDCIMENVQNPVIIDQNYCPGNDDCPHQVSGVKISDVTYQNIHGTSATVVAVKLDCSPSNPCTGIRMADVKLTYRDKPAETSCTHAAGSATAMILSSSCP